MKIALAIILATVAAFGQAKKASAPAAKPQQHQQHAHSHGEAKVDIGIEGNGGTVELEAAADPIVGFEHQPKNAAEKKQADAALLQLEKRFREMVIFPAAYGCSMTKNSIKYEVDGQHAEVHASFALKCAKPLKGANVTFGLSKIYPEIEEVKVQVVSETGQTGATIKKDKGSVKIG